MFDRFTAESKEAMNLARKAAQANATGLLDDVHILIGCCRARESLAVQVLRACGVDPDRVCTQAKERAAALPRDDSDPTQVPFTTSAKRVLEFAVEEALQAEHTSIGTHHLLLGLLRNGSANAVALAGSGLSLEDARQHASRVQILVEPTHRPALEKGFRSHIDVLREAQTACIELQEFETASILRNLIHKLEHPR